ncbi:hypothetical protein BVG16_13580 [Paenibacillus selenitireducens]|uniref:Uncharacterized protein n=2 Tax=Paenibacillus selenitireducens TaxID=1324314 RepID=A0A1T2XC60_9BACL|nr:hypothetical protein BVG16_13580 [Paenibacillus selenitireducens]
MEGSYMEDWSNNACLGYIISGMQRAGYSREEIKKVVRSVYYEFDFKSVDEAKDIYNKSEY